MLNEKKETQNTNTDTNNSINPIEEEEDPVINNKQIFDSKEETNLDKGFREEPQDSELTNNDDMIFELKPKEENKEENKENSESNSSYNDINYWKSNLTTKEDDEALLNELKDLLI